MLAEKDPQIDEAASSVWQLTADELIRERIRSREEGEHIGAVHEREVEEAKRNAAKEVEEAKKNFKKQRGKQNEKQTRRPE